MNFSLDWKSSELDEKTRDMLLHGGRDRIMCEVIDTEVKRLTENPTPQVIELVEDHSKWAPVMRGEGSDEKAGEIPEIRRRIANQSYEEVVENFIRNGRIPFDMDRQFQTYLRAHTHNDPQKLDELLLAKGKEHFQQYMQVPDESFNSLALGEFFQEWKRCRLLTRMEALNEGEFFQQLRLRLSRRMDEPDQTTRQMRFDYEQGKLKELEGKYALYQQHGVKPDLGRWM